MRVDDLAVRVDDLVLEVRLERVRGARGTDRVRHRLERERRLDEDGRRLVLEALSRIALAADLDLLHGRELRQRVDGLGKSGGTTSAAPRPASRRRSRRCVTARAVDVAGSRRSARARPRRRSARPPARRGPPSRRPVSSAPRGPPAAPCRRGGSRRGASSSPAAVVSVVDVSRGLVSSSFRSPTSTHSRRRRQRGRAAGRSARMR